MVYFKFLSEITDIGLRISFKESGVKFTDGSKDFRHYQPNLNDVKEIRSFKIRTGDVRPQVGGGRNIPKKPVTALKAAVLLLLCGDRDLAALLRQQRFDASASHSRAGRMWRAI